MSTNVIMPQMGESIAEGTVTKWLKKVGDRVERDEPLFEISTDKVDAEIPAPSAGVLTRILVEENQTVAVNAIVAEIDGEAAVAAAGREPSGESAAPVASSPAAGGSIPTPAPLSAADGFAGASTPAVPGGAPAASAPAPAPGPAAGPEDGDGHKIRSSPLVRRIAQDNQVDLRSVKGTGLGGRISKRDILAHISAGPSASSGIAPLREPQQAPVASFAPPATSQIPRTQPGGGAQHAAALQAGTAQVVPMTPMRKQIAEHMILSRRTSAHVTTVFEVEMTRIYETRAQNAAEFERRNGQKLTFTPFFVRAAVEAIKQYPIFNASVDGDNVVYKRDVNVGIAVALETGLIVPVVKRADEKNFLGVARAVTDLAERARSKRLNFDEVQGGSFTITNPGVFGSLFGTPIINQPQLAILGVGVIEKRAVVRNDAIAIRPMTYLALSFDHRVIDGAMADQFMVKVKTVLEDWSEAVL
jgi:pyruvate dehydrogenase E2 component (dihydrolipoamide acetyltransferase)